MEQLVWPPHAKSWLTGKDSVAGRDWGQEEKGTTEDEMAGWHHWLDGHESEWTPGVGDGQGGVACCDSWGRKELDTTERLNWTELNWNMVHSNISAFCLTLFIHFCSRFTSLNFTSSVSLFKFYLYRFICSQEHHRKLFWCMAKPIQYFKVISLQLK